MPIVTLISFLVGAILAFIGASVHGLNVGAPVAPMSDSIQKTLEAFRTAMRGSDQLIRSVDTRVIAMVDNLMETSARLRATRSFKQSCGRERSTRASTAGSA